MEIDHILKGLETHSDKLGMVVGALSTLDAVNAGDPMKGALAILQGLIAHPHIPNLSQVAAFTFGGYDKNNTLQNSILATLGGYFLKEIDILPQLTRVGNAVMKAGVGSAEAALVVTLLMYSGLSNSPPDPAIMANVNRSFGSNSREAW